MSWESVKRLNIVNILLAPLLWIFLNRVLRTMTVKKIIINGNIPIMGAGVLRIYSLPPSAFKGKILIEEIFSMHGFHVAGNNGMSSTIIVC